MTVFEQLPEIIKNSITHTFVAVTNKARDYWQVTHNDKQWSNHAHLLHSTGAGGDTSIAIAITTNDVGWSSAEIQSFQQCRKKVPQAYMGTSIDSYVCPHLKGFERTYIQTYVPIRNVENNF